MKLKLITWTIMLMVLTTTVFGLGPFCEEILTPNAECYMVTPPIQCSTPNYDILNLTATVTSGNLTLINSSIYYFIFNESEGEYIVHLCDNSTREIYVRGDDQLASLALTFFILGTVIFLVVLPFFKTFSKNPVTNFILRRSCWVLASFLMALNSGIMMSISEAAGYDLGSEIRIFMLIFGWGGYLLAAFMVISTLFETLKLWREWIDTKRFSLIK